MKTLLTLVRTYSSKFKLAFAIIFIVLLVGLVWYAKSTHDQLELSKELTDELTMQLAQSEQELVAVTESVKEEQNKSSALAAESARHERDAQQSKRKLEKFMRDYDTLSQEEPDTLAVTLVQEYNEYVKALSCKTGGKECDE